MSRLKQSEKKPRPRLMRRHAWRVAVAARELNNRNIDEDGYDEYDDGTVDRYVLFIQQDQVISTLAWVLNEEWYV